MVLDEEYGGTYLPICYQTFSCQSLLSLPGGVEDLYIFVPVCSYESAVLLFGSNLS